MATLPMFDRGEHGFTQQIEGDQDRHRFCPYEESACLSRQRHVGVILTPRLDKAWKKITPPAYTEQPAVERPCDFKSVKALEGSAIEFRLSSNRPLAGGRLTVTTEGAPETLAMTPSGERQVTGKMEARKPAQLKFSLVDADGLSSQQNWEATLTVTHDLPPEVQVTNPSSDSFVAMDFKAEPVIEANDDYGVKMLRIHTATNGTYGELRRISTTSRCTPARW